MTTVPTTPVPAGDGPDAGAVDEAGVEVLRTDAVLTGRAMSAGEYLAGLLAYGELETVGRPQLLPRDLFLGLDPEVVQEVWDRAVAVGFNAGRVSVMSARFAEEELLRVQERCRDAGFRAMAGLVGRSAGLVGRARHPADGEIARPHD